ncbi:Zn-ribbon domain-containing OB-fold protein [Alicyclobacillus fastidiosus]|uniref:Zn-ribbon domain-containing OB-fold protein n=1 Tax=Alicyclobacillus fastidiosus TaxID=392011 RepID=A0ABY6ZGM4_9BACL|nr:Zn-ribbon domain-containing OB-fold protein [Alicyclobacillus fastidiosus]WAH42017.1 Zn-ribbon domain-containing OB-fold protein [Alicyclobacillus fastidiosus]GMA63761.1 hypothetical protein GCM10025859_42010 [Alicyclobacillus fastidiosus]
MESRFPLPVRDGDSAPYWEGVDEGQLRIQKCQTCERHIFYPRSICPHCFSDVIDWVTASGAGRIYAYTVVHRSFGPFAEETPFVVAIVELAEGVRMMTRTKGPRDLVRIGAPVRVTFEKIDDNLTLPYFEVVDDAD